MYIYYAAEPAYRFYQYRFGLSDLTVIKGKSSRGRMVGYVEQLNQLAGKNRVWLLFSHVILSDVQGVSEEQFMVYYVNSMGEKIDEFRSLGSSIYLYDLGRE